jgi:hypothetical protein
MGIKGVELNADSGKWQGAMLNASEVDFPGMDCFTVNSKAQMNTLIAANIACLQQGIDLLTRFPGSDYGRCCPEVFGSSIGGHIRHNLDHYLAFTGCYDSGKIDYDDRERSLAMETDPYVAAHVMQELLAWLKAHAEEDLDRPLRIRMDDGGDSTWSQTTLRRELQFLLSHTIHHYALVVSIATRYGFSEFPDGFGVAPSTLHFQERKGA